MEKTIVKNLAANEFDLFQHLTAQNKTLFEFCVKNSNRQVYFESISEIHEYLKEINLDKRNEIAIRLKQFGFVLQKLNLSPLFPAQNVLMIFEGYYNEK